MDETDAFVVLSQLAKLAGVSPQELRDAIAVTSMRHWRRELRRQLRRQRELGQDDDIDLWRDY